MARADIGIRVKEAINKVEENKSIVIDAGKLSDGIAMTVNLSEMSRADLELAYIKSLVAVHLNNAGYYSTIRGKGLYVNPNNCMKEEYIHKIAENLNEDIQTITLRLKEIAKMFLICRLMGK